MYSYLLSNTPLPAHNQSGSFNDRPKWTSRGDEGVGIVTTEMVVYEWLEKANNDLFRTVLPLIK